MTVNRFEASSRGYPKFFLFLVFLWIFSAGFGFKSRGAHCWRHSLRAVFHFANR